MFNSFLPPILQYRAVDWLHIEIIYANLCLSFRIAYVRCAIYIDHDPAMRPITSGCHTDLPLYEFSVITQPFSQEIKGGCITVAISSVLFKSPDRLPVGPCKTLRRIQRNRQRIITYIIHDPPVAGIQILSDLAVNILYMSVHAHLSR